MANNFNIVWSGPKLDGKLDYNYWQIMMTTHLKAQNLWNLIEPGLAEGADANSQRRDQLALGQIHQGIDYSVFGQIAKASMAKEAWEILKVSYNGVDRAQKSKFQSLRRLYDRCEMTSTETVEQYFCHLTDLVNKMRLYGDKIEGAVVEKVLRTIPLKYDRVVSSITESHDIESLTIADCWHKKNNHDNQANIAENSGEPGEHFNESETLFLASNVLPDDENTWFSDTGCSNHMCGKKELFSELDESVRSEVTFGNKT